MPSNWPCPVFLLVFILLALVVGAYYTYIHPKQIHLESCYLNGGTCLELWNCEERYQSRVLTTCINKRKICCMQTIQMKNLQDAEDFAE